MRHYKLLFALLSLCFSQTSSAIATFFPVPIAETPATTSEREDMDRAAFDRSEVVFFGYNQAALDAKEQAVLDNLTTILANQPNAKILLQGHTDAKGSAVYNLKLAAKRAAAVRNHLVKHGIAPDRVEVEVYGEAKPAARNVFQDGSDAPDGRYLNRRVEILVAGIDQYSSAQDFQFPQDIPQELRF